METIIGKDMLNKSLPIGMVPILFSAAGQKLFFGSYILLLLRKLNLKRQLLMIALYGVRFNSWRLENVLKVSLAFLNYCVNR